jgi:mRNA interferase MazF
MARGDVFRVDLPPAAGGREQAGLRPAIAVQAEAGEILPTVMVVPVTSNLKAARFPFTVRVEPSTANGLTKPSVLLVFQLRAVDRQRIVVKIGHLEQEYLDQLDMEMRRLLNLP